MNPIIIVLLLICAENERWENHQTSKVITF